VQAQQQTRLRTASTSGSRAPAGRVWLCTALAGFLTGMWATAPAQADQTRFAVVDLDPKPEHDKLVAEVEKEIERLRPGSQRIEDEVMRRLLGSGEGPGDAAQRLLSEAERARTADDCGTATAKAQQAESMILAALSVDEERDLLKTLYILQVTCEAKLGRAAPLATAAARLRSMVSLPPSGLANDLWTKHVEKATFGAATVELQVDSDPANAQVAVNLHGEGVTPRTLKVAPGLVYVEVQKEGFKKAFRAVTVTDRPMRTVMRLVPRAQDRTEQTQNQLRFLQKGEIADETATMSRLSQLVRVETLVLLRVNGDKVKLSFFDAERGALADAPLESRWEPATGKVLALANRPSPPGGGGGGQQQSQSQTAPSAAQALTGSPTPTSAPASATAPSPTASGALPEAQAQKQQATYIPKKKRPGAPWWSWVIAGAVGVAFLGFMYGDQVKASDKIDVRATWNGGGATGAASSQ
jgi:hypothetical protein